MDPDLGFACSRQAYDSQMQGGGTQKRIGIQKKGAKGQMEVTVTLKAL